MERAHDISLDEPCVAHQAILFMLDVLMRSNKPALKLDELYDSFGDKSFTPQMLRAVGGNEQGLRAFLLTYPSLFTINNDLISANSGTNNGSGGQFVRLGGSLRKSKSNKTNVNASTTSGGDDTLAINGAETGSESGEGVRCQQPPSPSSRGVDGDQSASLLAQQLNVSKTMKEIEQEAIAFFRKQMTKREEDWLPIVSVAGHASQSSSDVRKFVGPQNEFKNFLLKYPHIFIVRDEYCGLKGRADVSTQPFPPPSPPPRRRGIIVPAALLNQVAGVPPGSNVVATAAGVTSVGNVLSRNHSFKTNHASTNRYSACANLMPNSPSNGNNGTGMYSPAGMFVNNGLLESYDRAAALTLASTDSSPPGAMLMNSVSNASIASSSVNTNTQSSSSSKSRLTPIEIRAVHYVMRILHKNGRMLLQTIPGLISRAPDQVSNIVGFTREDLIQFFKRHSAIFQLHPDGCVSVKQEAVKALILRDNNGANGSSIDLLNGTNGAHSPLLDNSGIISGSGVVLRIFPKYGILNMDNNEQVFFDIQSCQFETFSDLTTILHISDRLFFNAIIGPRDGSTKWRSIKTWIKMRSQRQNSSTNINGMAATNNNSNTILDSVSYHSDAEKSDDSSSNNSTSQHQQYRSAFRKQQLTGYQNNKTNSNSQMNRVNRNFVNSGGGYSDDHYMVDTTRHFAALAENNTFNSNQSGANGNNNNNNGSVEYSENETAAVNQNHRYMMNGELNQYFIDSQKRSPPLRNDISKSTVLSPTADEENGESSVEKSSGSESNSPATTAGLINNTNTSSTESTTTPYLNGKTTTTTTTSNNIESAKTLRASSDGVSQREIVNEKAISIGCQTLSTGPINPIALFSES